MTSILTLSLVASGIFFSLAVDSITFIARISCFEVTAIELGLKIPHFCCAIFSIVSPRIAVWSSPIVVITAQSGDFIVLVQSSRPPIPVSRTTMSQSAFACI